MRAVWVEHCPALELSVLVLPGECAILPAERSSRD